MKKEKDILNNIGFEETSKSFTSNLMKDIYALDQSKERSLAKHINKDLLLETSDFFNEEVMQKIETRNQIFKPVEIFSFKQILLFTFSILALILISIFKKPNISKIPNSITGNLNNIDYNSIFNTDMVHVSPILSISIFCMTCLLIIDFKMKKFL